MSKRLDVMRAITEMLRLALPGADVVSGDEEDSKPARLNANGRVVVRAGDPGEPEVDLGILTYWYDHSFPIEITVGKQPGTTAEYEIDRILVSVGEAIEADRTLGGLCIWMEPTAAETADVLVIEREAPAGRPPRGADFAIVATYGTPNPLF